MDLNRIWFTSDQHFGHENIIKYANRPFKDAEEMDETLIGSWNNCVAPNDTVYHLGDFTLSDVYFAARTFSKLNGSIFVLNNQWHHDKRWIESAYRHEICRTKNNDRVILLEPIYVIEPIRFDNKSPVPIIMCHYPIAQWDRKHYGSWHLHGHSHNTYQDIGYILDVGVDSAVKWLGEYRPFSLMEIIDIMVNEK